MAEPLSTKIPALDGGQVTNISPTLLEVALGTARSLKNVDVSAVGILRKRPGVQAVLSALDAAATGAHEYVKLSTGAVHKLASHGSKVQRWDTGTAAWVDVRTGLTAGQAHDFLTFADKVAMVNGADASALWDGTTVTTPADFPVAKYMAEFRLRIAAAGMSANPSRVDLCHTGDPTIWDPAVGGSNAVQVEVSPDDGEAITGLLNVGDQGLLIGKPTALYGLFGYTKADFAVDLLDSSVGVESHKSMVFISPHAYFVNREGIFRFHFRMQPERISDPIQDVFDDNVDKANLSKARAFRWKRYYVVSLPKTGGGTLTLAFHTSRGRWIVWDEPQVGEFMYVSDDTSGEIYYVEPGGSQFYRLTPGRLRDKTATPIHALFESQELDADNEEVEKDFGDLYVTCLTQSSSYQLDVSFRGDGDDWITRHKVQISGTKGRRKLVRVPLHLTARYLSVKIENNMLDEDFSPLALRSYYAPKEVL